MMRVLIADDRAASRRSLRALLAAEDDVELIGEATDGKSAAKRIQALQPDLVLLHADLRSLDGFGLVAKLGPEAMPPFILVAAHGRHAAAAFDAHAVDYLVQPYTKDRIHEALRRARARMAVDGARRQAPLARFAVRAGENLQVFRVDEIDWIEAEESYVRLHLADGAHLVRRSMSAMEAELPADRFARIHRSTIVNLDRVVALEPLFQGDCNVVLADGTRLRMSRRRRDALSTRLKTFT